MTLNGYFRNIVILHKSLLFYIMSTFFCKVQLTGSQFWRSKNRNVTFYVSQWCFQPVRAEFSHHGRGTQVPQLDQLTCSACSHFGPAGTKPYCNKAARMLDRMYTQHAVLQEHHPSRHIKPNIPSVLDELSGISLTSCNAMIFSTLLFVKR